MQAISTQLVYHQCLMCIFDVYKYQHAPKDRKATTQRYGAHVQTVLPFIMFFFHTSKLFLFFFVGFSFLCSTYSSVRHCFSSYYQAFLDFLLDFPSYVEPILPFSNAFLHIIRLFLTFCWVFLRMFNLLSLSPLLFFIFSGFS